MVKASSKIPQALIFKGFAGLCILFIFHRSRQLSGHSHAGQFFPLKYIYMFGEKYVYGDYQVGNTRLYVSSGITGWYYPFRTSAHCNYEVVHLAP